MKARIIGYLEIKQYAEEILCELEQYPVNDESIIEKGSHLVFLLGVCISQMKAPDSKSYPEKGVHLENLVCAKNMITYDMNTCTVEEVSEQVTAAFKAFQLQ